MFNSLRNLRDSILLGERGGEETRAIFITERTSYTTESRVLLRKNTTTIRATISQISVRDVPRASSSSGGNIIPRTRAHRLDAPDWDAQHGRLLSASGPGNGDPVFIPGNAVSEATVWQRPGLTRARFYSDLSGFYQVSSTWLARSFWSTHAPPWSGSEQLRLQDGEFFANCRFSDLYTFMYFCFALILRETSRAM